MQDSCAKRRRLLRGLHCRAIGHLGYGRASAALSLLLLLAACDSGEPGRDGGPTGQIGYVGADHVLYVIDLGSGDVEEMTALQEFLGDKIRWSPDGRQVAMGGLGENMWPPDQIYVMDADGSDLRLVTLWEHNGRLERNPNLSHSPVWSPDRTRVAFTRCTNCEVGGVNREIFIVDLDTTEGLKEVRLTENLLSDGILDWSADGSRILFRSEEAPDGMWDRYGDIYEMNADGSGKRRILVNDSTFGRSRARYSPDGSQIAFIGGAGSNEIYVARADGSDIQRLTDNDLSESSVSWSPDGEWIAFWADVRRVAGNRRVGHIYVIRPDGTEQRRITSGSADYGAPEWRPRRE